ncbi:DNA polymerase/3'-5' exonuclease PolX [Siminovitchia sp. 179-K 8D1 HS]|uniref:DNA polymerase/3'-5' exonuclease PolX n=1 Tax=Siminovitchia sp. 179-K 8D1 HS TaxID=3142385 RepID=UPI0039A05E3C
MEINKKDVIRLLEQIAMYMELKGENPFKTAAFRKAAAALEADDRSLSEITDFTKIPGIGKGTAAVIGEFTDDGVSSVLQQLQEEVPKGLIPLLQIPGLGGKTIARLYKELNVTDVESLKAVCAAGKLRTLKGFGKKTEENIKNALEQMGRKPSRFPIAYMLPLAGQIESFLKGIKQIEQFSRAGSLRRVSETMKDLDFVIATEHPGAVKEQLLQLDGEAAVTGDTKVTIELNASFAISVDFRIVKPGEFATALHHFTGSAEHNVRMRQIAKERGEKISEYGVENTKTGKVKTFQSEKDFFRHFQLPWIPPEIRVNGKEIDEFSETTQLIETGDIKGDLHMHTTWSDGAYSLEEMVEACRKKGYEYMAITDHSQFLRVANGLTADRLRKQNEAIKTLNEKYDDIVILSGIEMDILPDGRLDFDDGLLSELDIVIASIHSSFSQPMAKIMDRLTNALQNPHVDIIAHPTGRLIGRRDGYEVDMDMLIDLAKETNTALELNANPARLDLAYSHLQKAQETGVNIVINTDAHNIGNLDYMDIGVSYAKKGWIHPGSVINAWTKDKLLAFLKRND